jgi:hypothetical protein
MQIHELTQPRKPRLDEIEMFGPGGLADEIGAAFRNPKQALGFTKDGKFSPGLAQQQADQNELNRRASKAIAQGQKMGLDQKPTLAVAKERLKANQIAQKWISDTVAKWPEAAKRFNATPVSIDEERVSRRRGSTPGVINSKDLDPSKFGPDAQATLAAAGAPEFQPAPGPTASDPKKKLRDNIKSWINQQLKVVSLEAIASAENNGLEGLAGTTQTLKKNLDDMVANAENETAQQTALKNILVLATEANYLIDWERRVGRGQTLADPGAGNRAAQPVNTSLTTAQLQTLGALAARSGDPAPKDTGSDFWNSFIQQAIAAAKQ